MLAPKWYCKCACGAFTFVAPSQLLQKKTRSCGCLRNELTQQRNIIRSSISVGSLFGKLTVIGREERRGGEGWWRCQCVCGNEHSVTTYRLNQGITKSCGCLRREYGGLNRLPGTGGAFNKLFSNYRRSAIRRNYKWELDKATFRTLVCKPCSYCGVKNGSTMRGENTALAFSYTGIDRIDNTEGYTVANSAPCCSACNFGKRTQSRSEFIAWAARITKYQQEGSAEP